ncbi:hypothetical protein ACTNDU_02945, partial [Hallella faecis]|uniref:hypothetical protein n=1 Tax=Hallella faecis TaxID=2841596 RepID=UPI003F8C16D8
IHSAKVLLLDNHVSFGNIVFGLASAQHSTGFVGCAEHFREAVARKDAVKRMILREENGTEELYHLCFENILCAFGVYSILFL